MKAIVQHRYGTPLDVLRLAEATDPSPAAGEVLVRVEAASVNAADWHLVSGEPLVMRLAGLGLRRPRAVVPGSDVAGRVVALGSDVTDITVGDRVVGWGRGAFAELAAVPASQVVPLPDDVDAVMAAAVPMAGMTALQAVRDIGLAVEGQRVLVTGASGGVGTFAVQLAVAAGAHVTASCRTGNVELVRSLGAHAVIDRTREAVPGHGPYDVIVHIGGRTSVRALRGALTRRGTLVLVTGDGGRWAGPLPAYARAAALSAVVPQRLAILVSKEDQADLRTLVGMVADGVLTPAVDRIVSLADVPSVVAALRDGQGRGKVVVAP